MSRDNEGTMQSRYPLLKKWTAEDDQLLKKMAAAGCRPNVIAEKLSRSEAAVRSLCANSAKGHCQAPETVFFLCVERASVGGAMDVLLGHYRRRCEAVCGVLEA